MAQENLKYLLDKYSQYCPRCKQYIEGFWGKCDSCGSPLISAKSAYRKEKIKSVIGKFIIVAIVLSPLMATYVIQPNEREQYRQSVGFFLKGEFKSSRAVFQGAWSDNPMYKFFKKKFKKKKKPFIIY